MLSLFLVAYSYFGYPLSLCILKHFRQGNTDEGDGPFTPPVTVIISAYNEEDRIEKKIQNTLDLEYPRDQLQIIVASDGSTDRTDEIVGEYRNQGVELSRNPERKGKEEAQKRALQQAKGEIIVFSDAATILEKDGVLRIVSGFRDPSVGCVSSEDVMIDQASNPSGEGFYVKYEMWLRKLESRVNSVVGLSGSFFAARKEVCRNFSGDMQSDFRTLLNSVRIGLRGVSDSNAKGYYRDISSGKKEFDRKVRTVLRGLTVFFNHTEFLNVFRFGLFSYQFFCHKLLRWLVPWLLILAFAASAFLACTHHLWTIVFLLQLLFYGIALIGMKKERPLGFVFVRIPSYFFMVNLGIFVAWLRFFRGEKIVMWQPSQR
jgi:glycosyltransferase involved in cell wall biosynthesis